MSRSSLEVIGLDHVYVSIRDFERSERFYDQVFELLGFRKGDKPIAGEPHAHYFNKALQFTIRPAHQVGASHDPYAPGLHHVCFQVATRSDVDAAFEGLTALGVTATRPRPYPRYNPDYYALFFDDPDGIRLEIVARTPYRDRIVERWNDLRAFLNPLADLDAREAGGTDTRPDALPREDGTDGAAVEDDGSADGPNVSAPAAAERIVVRPLAAGEITAADDVMRRAFGTFIGLADPSAFMHDASYVEPRFTAWPETSFVALRGTDVVGSNFAARWGSFGFFGPLSVQPDLWDQGIAAALMEPVLDLFARWGTRHCGLFTFSNSPKHLGLYQKFGFLPAALTAIAAKPVAPVRVVGAPAGIVRYSRFAPTNATRALTDCFAVTNRIFEGLDLGDEILAVERYGWGDTLLLVEDSRVTGFAVCHHGAGTEGGSATCYVKFAAVMRGPKAATRFARLLDACEQFAAEVGAERVVAGVNTARREAYADLQARGYRTEILGIAMTREGRPGFNRSGVYVLDDWR